MPSSFQWSSSAALISPKTDAAHPIVSVKDPTVVRWNNRWLVYMTTANTRGQWSLAYASFADWSQASAAPLTYLDQNPKHRHRIPGRAAVVLLRAAEPLVPGVPVGPAGVLDVQ